MDQAPDWSGPTLGALPKWGVCGSWWQTLNTGYTKGIISPKELGKSFFTALQNIQSKTINMLQKEEELVTKHELLEMQATHPISEAVLWF